MERRGREAERTGERDQRGGRGCVRVKTEEKNAKQKKDTVKT